MKKCSTVAIGLFPGSLISRWNWKSALLSSLFRGSVFFSANLRFGRKAAVGAMFAEFLYRALTSGFYGAITQKLRSIEPRWKANIIATLGIPAASHLVEFLVHYLRGTPNLRGSILMSVIFTVFSTLFNLHAMRRGILLVGQDQKTLGEDFRAIPVLLVSFVISGFGLFARKGDRPAS
jgi:hypothetical protein